MPPLMRPNPVRANLQAGGNVYGTNGVRVLLPRPNGDIGRSGADFVLLDTEHSGVGIETIKAQLRGLGIVPMVRVPGCHYHLIALVLDHLIALVLDAGAMGVPMVETAAQAQQIHRVTLRADPVRARHGPTGGPARVASGREPRLPLGAGAASIDQFIH
jgi:2-keto-3-deoxy-L-rhamnonate aldolase RhmA